MIYLLEDDESIRELVAYSLDKTGNETCGFALPSELYAAVERRVPDLIILDVMLPEEDGITVLNKLRAEERTRATPVIMLTARDGEFDKVIALDSGADDYVTKPFGVMELVARVRALLRRSSVRATESEVYALGSLTVSELTREVRADGEEVLLTFKEFELLRFLLRNRGVVLGREKILNEVWGYDFDGENRTVDVHIRTLRRKLGKCADLIETVRGVGYRISKTV